MRIRKVFSLFACGPLRRLRPSPPRGGSSGAGYGSSAPAVQTFHIQLRIYCSPVALSGSASPLSAGHPSASHPSFARGAPSGVRLPAWTASVAVFPHLSITYSSHLLQFFTSLWPAAFRRSLALTPAGRYPLRHILFGLARRLPLASKVRPARRADVILLLGLDFNYLTCRWKVILCVIILILLFLYELFRIFQQEKRKGEEKSD